MIKQQSMKLALKVLLFAVTTVALVTLALLPRVTVAHGAVIVDTVVTSSIIDHSGIAVSVIPFGLSCGVDSTVWCEVADDSDATPAGLIPLGQ